MRTKREPNFLTETQLQERIEAFRGGPHTVDYAADCGLLALTVPTLFGGLFVDTKREYEAFKSLKAISERVNRQIYSHWQTCRIISSLGSAVQFDLFLPGLASGKRIGVNATRAKELHIEFEENRCYVTGWGVGDVPILDHMIVMMNGPVKDCRYYLAIPASALSSVRKSGHGNFVWSVTRGSVGLDSVFTRRSNAAENSSTEKWEAIRWRTDRSAS